MTTPVTRKGTRKGVLNDKLDGLTPLVADTTDATPPLGKIRLI